MKIIDRFNNLNFNPFNVSWLNETDKHDLWINYLFNHSGFKEESPLLENYVFNDLTDDKLIQLKHIISTMFDDKWDKLHDALIIEYNPIDNYNRIEDTETTTAGTNNTTGSNNNTDVMTGGHDTTTSDNNIHKVSAYDDDSLVNDNSDTKTRTDNLIYNNETKTTTGTNSSETDTTGNSVTHSVVKGNIGVTTTQQMLTSEIELRRFNLINEMYNDLDTILTIGVYVY